VAGRSQRDLIHQAGRYPRLFAASPFDAAFFSTITLANGFCAPWLDEPGIRATNRVTLWIFGVDRLIDHVAGTAAEVDELVRRCGSAAAGSAGTGPAAQMLAELRADLAADAGFAALGGHWRDEVHRMLHTMAREWRWRAGPDRPPTLAEYLDNAQFGFTLVYLTHWIHTVGELPPAPTRALLAAGQAVQRVIRLLNDQGTIGRDRRLGDLNALLLADESTVDRELDRLVGVADQALAPLADRYPELVLFLRRQIEFNTGFYRVGDYQGEY